MPSKTIRNSWHTNVIVILFLDNIHCHPRASALSVFMVVQLLFFYFIHFLFLRYFILVVHVDNDADERCMSDCVCVCERVYFDKYSNLSSIKWF